MTEKIKQKRLDGELALTNKPIKITYSQRNIKPIQVKSNWKLSGNRTPATKRRYFGKSNKDEY